MKTYEVITAFQLLAGIAIILVSFIRSMKARRAVPRSISTRQLIAVSIAALFLMGFVFSILSLLTDIKFPFELLFGSLFLGSACFVHVAFKITSDAYDHLAWKTDQFNRAEDKLKALSLNDGLTGLCSRHGFFTFMEHHLKLARRHKIKVILFYAYIDDLKSINENFGQQEGDMVIKETANILKTSFRSSDIMARIGDGEFIVLLIEASEDHFEEINDKFHKTLEAFNSGRHQKYKLSLSTGVTSYDPAYNESIDNLLAHVYELADREKSQREKVEVAV